MNVTDTSWVDRDEYPFRSRYLALEMGRMHYIDEGEGEPVVMVHGTPDWSFVWRHLIRRLSAHWRCVAMDHVGFGLSDKAPGWSYRPEDHARNVKARIEKLDLGEMILVVHDFGVPIGLAFALERPENVKRLVLFNGWLWPLESDRTIKRVMRVMTSPLGWFLYTRMNFSAKVIMKAPWGQVEADPEHSPAVPRTLPHSAPAAGSLGHGEGSARFQRVVRGPLAAAPSNRQQARARAVGYEGPGVQATPARAMAIVRPGPIPTRLSRESGVTKTR